MTIFAFQDLAALFQLITTSRTSGESEIAYLLRKHRAFHEFILTATQSLLHYCVAETICTPRSAFLPYAKFALESKAGVVGRICIGNKSAIIILFVFRCMCMQRDIDAKVVVYFHIDTSCCAIIILFVFCCICNVDMYREIQMQKLFIFTSILAIQYEL